MTSHRLFAMFIIMPILLALMVQPCSGQEEAAVMPALAIENAIICKDIVDLEPVGSGDVFSADIKKLMCFTRVVGAAEETQIHHNWYFGETMVASIPLRVGSSNWRTYSSKTILPEHAGEWKVEIVSADGQLLKKIYFILE